MNDRWNGKQAGFRSDVGAWGGALTVQGDAYDNRVDTPSGKRSGGNVLANWSKALSNGSTVRVQAYFDDQSRDDNGPAGGIASDKVQTVDLQAEQLWSAGVHQLVWGIGQRAWRDRFVNTTSPPRRAS